MRSHRKNLVILLNRKYSRPVTPNVAYHPFKAKIINLMVLITLLMLGSYRPGS